MKVHVLYIKLLAVSFEIWIREALPLPNGFFWPSKTTDTLYAMARNHRQNMSIAFFDYNEEATRFRAHARRLSADLTNLRRRFMLKVAREEPFTKPTVEVYSRLKEAWKEDHDLISYEFPIMAICPHDGYVYYVPRKMCDDLQFLVWDKCRVLIPFQKDVPSWYDVDKAAVANAAFESAVEFAEKLGNKLTPAQRQELRNIVYKGEASA